MQALLSAASLCVGMILIRNASDAQYGYYVLITNAALLMTSLQSAYIQPSVIIQLNKADVDQHQQGAFIGGLYREQRALLPVLAVLGVILSTVLWYLGVIDSGLLMVIIAGTAAVVATLYREFFRMVLLAYRRPHDVVRGDTIYVVLLVAGAWFAVHTSVPAVAAAVSLMLAAIAGGFMQRHSLWRFSPWSAGARGVLRSIVVVGFWATAGAGIHWAFTQGYNYLVAGVLGVNAVAAIAATRILMMPVNLISTGINSFMFPTVAGWLQHHPVMTVFRRLLLLAAGMVVVAVVYLGVLWLLRDWIFDTILRKQFARRDTLLALWSVICVMMVMRDQLLCILAAKAQFRRLSVVALISAVVSLVVSYFAMQQYAEPGALVGIIAGEIISVVGIVVLTMRAAAAAPSEAPSASS